MREKLLMRCFVLTGRRKQKWAVDPRNTAWSNDDSKFGQRMLEKMGWSKGKGLGAQEQGAVEHIKVQVKNNHLGLGAVINNEDNWIAHQDGFNQLLAELNSRHGQETADCSDNKEKKSFSLEEKSKVSKSRVHYMKFTKASSCFLGKDLSSRSKTDLDCIFGKRQNKKTPEVLSHRVDLLSQHGLALGAARLSLSLDWTPAAWLLVVCQSQQLAVCVAWDAPGPQPVDLLGCDWRSKTRNCFVGDSGPGPPNGRCRCCA
ncbi:PIN2/TERF1-interacting telomerase inhibitor 1 [Galemys pyrenaicus]|uniref:PIN2/TERF1-interacting telomerase inhibitor 1 n=1 Tax=Galemys pyrenaicus TaxID=202257 RepID=A0A8J5ZK01_GALPY|nr:PIN2/TERF1-interacting telomerase inhibitor 1 [Galemys pyrenaicus]